MSPTCWQDEIEARAKKCTRVEDELEELKYWVQDLSNELDRFVEGIEYEDDIVSIGYIMEFVRQLQEKLEKKKNKVMGYK